MKNFKNIALALMATALIAGCANMNRLAKENHELKQDTRILLSEMDADGTLERYDGSDHVCRLIRKTFPMTQARRK